MAARPVRLARVLKLARPRAAQYRWQLLPLQPMPQARLPSLGRASQQLVPKSEPVSVSVRASAQELGPALEPASELVLELAWVPESEPERQLVGAQSPRRQPQRRSLDGQLMRQASTLMPLPLSSLPWALLACRSPSQACSGQRYSC